MAGHNGGLAAVRGEMATIHGEMATIRGDMAAVRGDMAAVRGEITTKADTGFVHSEFAALRAEMIAGDEETRRQMRVLHEDLVGRIALIQEGLPRRGGPRRKSR